MRASLLPLFRRHRRRIFLQNLPLNLFSITNPFISSLDCGFKFISSSSLLAIPFPFPPPFPFYFSSLVRPITPSRSLNSSPLFPPIKMSSTPVSLDLKSLQDSELDSAILKQGSLIRDVKSQGASKDQLQGPLSHLKILKEEKMRRSVSIPSDSSPKTSLLSSPTFVSVSVTLPSKDRNLTKLERPGLEALLIRRFFYAPSFAIYGGTLAQI